MGSSELRHKSGLSDRRELIGRFETCKQGEV